MTNEQQTIKTLKQQLARAHKAVHYLWGFWDGNTLVPSRRYDSELQDDIQRAFEDCLEAVEGGADRSVTT